MQVGVVYTSISAYPLLSAYFPTTYAYKRMRLITRVYGMRASPLPSCVGIAIMGVNQPKTPATYLLSQVF